MRDLGPSPNKQAGRSRTRLVPPKLGEVEQRTRHGKDALRWSTTLRGTQRRKLAVIAGNVALLLVLLGGPVVRGYYRARATELAHARFLGCLYGVQVTGGLGAFPAEAEYLAARLKDHDQTLIPRCLEALDLVAPSPALFVSPWIKQKEERAREAVAMTRSELEIEAKRASGTRMPVRVVRALKLLRAMVSAQLVQAGLDERLVKLPPILSAAAQLAAPARLQLYAAPDATLSLWGDDQRISIAALDANGLAYLEVDPSRPLTRARLVRPRSLHALVSSDQRRWLVWSTAAARCRERADACFGKTTAIAIAPSPLFELPASRAFGAHLAGRPDRSLLVTPAGFLLATVTADRRAHVQRFAAVDESVNGADLPALAASETWPASVDQALLLATNAGELALGVTHDAKGSQLVQLRADSTTQLAVHKGLGKSWLAACAHDRTAGFAFGNGEQIQIGRLARADGASHAHLWSAMPLNVEDVVDPEQPSRDRVIVQCRDDELIVVARDTSDRLSAFVCSATDTRCDKFLLASGVKHFSALATKAGALVAYAGPDQPQIRVRSIDSAHGLSAERVPAACWTNGGLCTRPTLARLGSRIVLVAPEKTDLLALESADEGVSWSAPPVL